MSWVDGDILVSLGSYNKCNIDVVPSATNIIEYVLHITYIEYLLYIMYIEYLLYITNIIEYLLYITYI